MVEKYHGFGAASFDRGNITCSDSLSSKQYHGFDEASFCRIRAWWILRREMGVFSRQVYMAVIIKQLVLGC